jgi:flagellum-specific ATP synthase
VLVVTPSNSPPLFRLRGAYVATAIAEFFRDQGLDVMLLFDSVTRFARALREIGLASGEPPATRGYTPSMFDSLPKLLERSGTSETGSITGFYTILVDGDDMDEPVSDTVRGILDGHIVLSRALANSNHYPPVDVLGSVSRVMTDIVTREHLKAAGFIRNKLAVYREASDLINIGAYQKGANPEIDEAVRLYPVIQSFLQQERNENYSYEEIVKQLTAFTKQ